MSTPEVSERTALVTGGSRGIGKACALELARAGYHVAVTYVSKPDAAQQTVAAIEAHGQKSMAVALDVADAAQCQAALDSVMAAWGRIDVLVNNAGLTKDTLIVRMTDDDWQRVINANLSGAFYLCRGSAKLMMKQRTGCIINITSVSGLYGNAGQANYAASKAGLIGLTKTLAKELAGRGIRANAVAPGFIATDMTADLPQEKIQAMIPLGRLGTPEDIAKTVAFLADPQSYITGQVIEVSGGLVL
ncbi:MAG: 3-oxoacyl-[acyl-carrier-protein] reductase [Vampirovibrionales bacterium]|nr:3-oxoacyl-[acyl-carrier-protein] reductase [Vampirovibrionales bacterium]